MNRSRWLQGNEKTNTGQPCFIKTENKLPVVGGMKAEYIWGSGKHGFGFYHLTTREAYVNIYNRIHNNKVNTGADEVCCGCFGGSDPASKMPTVKADDRDDMRLLFHARSVASTPCDAQAKAEQIVGAQATANAMYHYDQNVQLGMIVGNEMAR